MTPEGLAVSRAIDRGGVWQRAGDLGMVTGLSMAEAMASLPPGCDQDFARRLFTVAEGAFVTAINKKVEEDNG